MTTPTDTLTTKWTRPPRRPTNARRLSRLYGDAICAAERLQRRLEQPPSWEWSNVLVKFASGEVTLGKAPAYIDWLADRVT